MDTAQAVVQLDQELMPVRTLGSDDRLLEDRPRILCPPLLHQGDRERQLSARPQLDRDRPHQDPRDEGLGTRSLAVEQTHFGFREGKLEGGGGVAWLFEEVIDWPLQAARDDSQVLRGGLGATQLDLVEEGSAKVAAGHRGKAEAQLLPCLTNPTPERTRRSGVIRRRTPRAPLGKHNLQSSNLDLTAKSTSLHGVRPDFGAGKHGRSDDQENPRREKTPHGPTS